MENLCASIKHLPPDQDALDSIYNQFRALVDSQLLHKPICCDSKKHSHKPWWGPELSQLRKGVTRGQATWKTDKPSPGTPLGVTRGQATWKTDKPSPGTPLRVTRGQATWRADKPFPGTPLGVTRGQATWRTDKPMTCLSFHHQVFCFWDPAITLSHFNPPATLPFIPTYTTQYNCIPPKFGILIAREFPVLSLSYTPYTLVS